MKNGSLIRALAPCFAALSVALSYPSTASGQCPNDNTLQGAAITIPCPGSYSPVPCVRGGRYLLVNVTVGRTYTFATCGTVLFDTYLTLVNNAGGAVLAFSDDACGTQSSITWTATFTGQVRILVDQTSACNSTSVCTSLHISCSTTAPVNDLICNATTLTVNASCSNLSPSPTNVAATNTIGPPAPGCAGYNGGDVWFTLTVPAGGAITIRTRSISSSALLDAGMAAYSSSDNTCTGVLTLLGCNDDIDFPYNEMSELNLTGLTVGNTIFIRVWEADNDQFGRFNICAFITPPLPDAQCQAISVPVGTECEYQNFTNVGATTTNPPGAPSCGSPGSRRDVWYSFTAPASGNVVIQTDIGSMTDAAMALYSSSNGLCSGTLTQIECDDDDGMDFMPYIYRTGLTPGTTYWLRVWGYGGVSGTFQLCLFNPLGTRLEDCVGGTTVCDDQFVENTSLFTGNVADLVPVNRGCLAAAERQGTWYAFSIGNAGNLGYTLSPLASDDYDFALWGPYPSGSFTGGICPPGSAPIRCSFASGPSTFAATGSYNTGLANGAFVTPQYAGPATCPTCSENPAGDGWVSGINVSANEVYLLYVSNYSQSGSAFVLSWDLAAGATLQCTVLPVELLSLTAIAGDVHVTIKWTTLSERHSDYFVIERSSDGLTFHPIGMMDAAGDSQQRIDYVYIDPQPFHGPGYYRLKQVDQDGAYEHLPAVFVFFGNQNSAPLVFPNPAKESVHVVFEMPVSGTMYTQVIDASGRVVRDLDRDLDRGEQTISLNINGLAPGIYDLRLVTTATGGSQRARFMIE